MTTRICPRCQAAGVHAPLDDASRCEACGTAWVFGEWGQPVSVGRREVAS